MSAARNAEAKRVTSIARAINWSYMWRRLMSYVWLDLLLLLVAAAILVYGYNQTLPDGAFTAGWIPGAAVRSMSLTPARGWDLTTLTYTVELARNTKTFPLAQDLVTLWPLYLVVAGWQVISVLNMLGGARRVRRTMAPLNDLALRVDELGRMQLAGGKMETLEQAIERASVDSPSVTTGDADLASIEVALNRLLRQMQEAKLQQMRFVNDASHELRTPMTTIKGFIDGMLDGTIPPENQNHYLGIVSQEVGRLTRLIKNMLDITKLEAGEYKVNATTYDIWESITSVVFGAEQRLEANNIQISGFAPTKTLVLADQDLVYQVIYNLVDNAIKFCNVGGEIRFSVTQSKGAVTVGVRNTGAGIAPEALPYVFDRFYKEDKSRGLNTTGSGLGLHICKVLINLSGGKIWVDSKEGEYCEFLFTLPAPPSSPIKGGKLKDQ